MAGRRGRGEGSLTFDTRDGRWVGRVTLPDGRRPKVSGRTRAEALARMRQLRTEVADGHNPDGRLTLGEWAETWVTGVLPGRVGSSRTVDNYASVLRQHVVPHIGSVRLRNLSIEDVEAMLAVVAEQGYSKSTVNRCRAVLSLVLVEAERRGRVTRNVAKLAVLPPTTPRKPRTTFSREQARSLVEAARGERLESLWLTALYLGLRPGELLGLTWRDVELGTAPVIHLRESLRADGVLGALKAGARRRSLAVPVAVAEAIRRHRVLQLAEEQEAGEDWTTTFADLGGLVWPSRVGTPINPSNLRRSFAALRVRAGVEGKWTPYSLRHTAVSLLSDAGVSPERIADLLGHVDIRMVMSVYRHTVTPVVDTAATALDDVLGGPYGPSSGPSGSPT